MSDFVDAEATRALQASEKVRLANLGTMQKWGAYNLLKVVARGEPRASVSGYITLLQALSGLTPRQMEDLLGLKKNQLAEGADIYRLLRIPGPDEFLPRGYTTLVDGLHLREGLSQDSHGYRPGQGALQIAILPEVSIEAVLIASLGPDEPFKPGVHPKYLAR